MMNPQTIFILFGATGDLARLKILPALHSLAKNKQLGAGFKLIAVGRKDMSTVEYISYLAHVESNPFTEDLAELDLEYLALDFEEAEGFDPLWHLLENYSRGNQFFYMSLGPDILELCLKYFRQANDSRIWSAKDASVLIEKPFGESGKSAVILNKELISLFGENVYRHDHYLSKDTVEAIIDIRQQDAEINSILNHEYLSQVKLVVSEKIDIGSRAGYFEYRGMLVDWFQSHMLQILASVCARSEFTRCHEAKAEFIRSLTLEPDSILRAQYLGYRDAQGVKENSETETFLAVKLRSKLPKWENTVFALAAGKAMAEKEVQITFKFSKPHPKFGDELVWSFDPPGGHPLLKKLSGDEFSQSISEFISHSPQNFVSMPEIIAQWKITDEIKKQLLKTDLGFYNKGTPFAVELDNLSERVR